MSTNGYTEESTMYIYIDIFRALTAIQSNNQDLTRLDQKSHKTHVHHIMLKF